MEEKSKQWGLNGVGRIGREVLAQNVRLNQWPETSGIAISAINETFKTIDEIVAVLRQDLIHGRFPNDIGEVKERGNDFVIINGLKVKVTHEREPRKAWEGLGLFGVIDATGEFRKKAQAQKHLEGTGVQHVLITAPSPDSDLSLVAGINDAQFNGQPVVDNASCTTKSALPVIQTLDREFGIVDSTLKTVHAATGKSLRKLMDRIGLKEASPEDIVRLVREGLLDLQEVDWINDEPTGAASNVVRILPQLEGRFRAGSKRVASPNGSVSIMDFVFRKEPRVQDIREVLQAASRRYPVGVLRIVPTLPTTADVNVMNDDAVVPLDKIEGRSLFTVESDYSNEVGPARSTIQTARVIENWKAA